MSGTWTIENRKSPLTPTLSPWGRGQGEGGFTLIELLVVIAIIAILMALLLPAVQKVREAANKMRCANQLKQMGLAIHMFHNDHARLPPGGLAYIPSSDWSHEQGTWMVHILPYLEAKRQYDVFAPYIRMNLTSNDCGNPPGACRIQRGFSGWNPTAEQYNRIQSPPVYRCPSYSHDYDGWAASTYGASTGPQCMNGPCGYDPYLAYCDHTRFPKQTTTDPVADINRNWGADGEPSSLRGCFNRYGTRIRLADIKDGASSTIWIGEMSPQEVAETAGSFQFEKPSDGEATYGFANYLAGTGHWIASNAGYGMGGTLSPINYRTDRQQLCNPDFGTWIVTVLAPSPAPITPGDPDLYQRSWQNWNLSWGFKSRHPGGANFLFGDGSVHFLNEEIEHWTYQFLGCRKDGIHIEDLP